MSKVWDLTPAGGGGLFGFGRRLGAAPKTASKKQIKDLAKRKKNELKEQAKKKRPSQEEGDGKPRGFFAKLAQM